MWLCNKMLHFRQNVLQNFSLARGVQVNYKCLYCSGEWFEQAYRTIHRTEKDQDQGSCYSTSARIQFSSWIISPFFSQYSPADCFLSTNTEPALNKGEQSLANLSNMWVAAIYIFQSKLWLMRMQINTMYGETHCDQCWISLVKETCFNPVPTQTKSQSLFIRPVGGMHLKSQRNVHCVLGVGG